MSSAGIGRLLTASLHQAISELLPARVSFYEPWLSSDTLRTNRVSLAGVRAAFSFLRQEPDAYDAIMTRAGELAAAWTWRDCAAVRRAWLRAMPAWVRARVAVAFARGLVTDTWRETRTSAHWRRGNGRVTVSPSLFCEVRNTTPGPLCAYYASALATFLRELGVGADVRVESCRATGHDGCAILVTRSRRASTAVAAGLAALLACLGATGAAAQETAPPAAFGERVLVVPFENTGRDPRLSWLTEGAALLVTAGLRAQGINAMTRDERLRAFDRLQVPPLASLSRATVIRIGLLVGAADVVTGTLARAGDEMVITARRLRIEPGVLGAEVTERAGAADLVSAFARLSRRLGQAGETAGAVPAGDSGPPLAAFEAYVKGLLAETPAVQLGFLRQALQAWPSYAEARLALWQAHTAAGDHRAAMASIQPMIAAVPPPVDAAFLHALSLLHLGQVRPAVDVLAVLQARSPSAVFLNNLGVAALRDPAAGRGAGSASWHFNQARLLDGLDPDYLFNLGYAYWRDGDPAGGSYWLRECVRLSPADGAAHALLAQALHASGSPAEAARELSLAQRLSSEFDGVDLKAAGPGAAAPRGLERLKDTLDAQRSWRIDAALEVVGRQDEKDAAAFYLERGRRLADRGLDREAEAELTRASYLAPYDAEVHLLLGRIYLRTGRVREAIDAAKISLWSAESAGAHLVLAEAHLHARDDVAARRETDRALALEPGSTDAKKLLDRLPKPPSRPDGPAAAV